MKLLFVHPYNIDYPGGAEKWVVEVAIRLKRKKHEIGVVNVNWPNDATYLNAKNSLNLLKHGIRVLKCSYIKLLRGYPMLNPSTLKKISACYDVLYVSAYPPNEFVIHFVKRVMEFHKPIIAVFHSLLQPQKSILHHLYIPFFINLYRGLDKLHVLNNYLYRLFINNYRIPPKKVVLIPNGVDTSTFKPITSSKDLSSERFEVLFVSRFVLEKGIDVLGSMIRWINEKHANMKDKLLFKIAGEGPLKSMIERLASKYSNVIYLGFLDKDLLVREYSRSHVLVITSYVENMPLTLLEASACGLPTVASAVPGVSDVIKTLDYGVLVKPGSYIDFAQAILKVYEFFTKDPSAYFQTRRNIRERTIQNYDWRIIVDRIEEVCKALQK